MTKAALGVYLQRLGITSVASLEAALLAVILLVGAVLRFAGLSHGLPLVFGDEDPIVRLALAISWEDLNPHSFYYGSLGFYVFKAASFFADVVSQSFGAGNLSRTEVHLVLRSIGALGGLGTIYFTYYFGRLLIGPIVGLLAAALLAFSPLSVRIAHHATVDPLLGLWSSLALVGMAMWIKDSRYAAAVTGLGIGLAISTKFNAVVLLIPLVLLAYQEQWSRKEERLTRGQKLVVLGVSVLYVMTYFAVILFQERLLDHVASWSARGVLLPVYRQMFERLVLLATIGAFLLITVNILVIRKKVLVERLIQPWFSRDLMQPLLIASVVFIATSPYVILDYPNFVRDFFFQMNKSASGAAASVPVDSIAYQALQSTESTHDRLQYVSALGDEWGTVALVLLSLGFAGLYRWSRTALFPFVTLVVIVTAMTLSWRYLALRWLYPLWPLYTMLIATGIVFTAKFVTRTTYRYMALLVVAGVLLSHPLVSSMRVVSSEFMRMDTRTLTFDWIAENVAPGTAILREMEAPDIENIRSDVSVYVSDLAFEEKTLDEWYAEGIRVVVIGERRLQFYQTYPEQSAIVLTEYRMLKDQWLRAAHFSPNQTTKGPAVSVYVAP